MDSIKAGITLLGRANEPLSLRLTVADVRQLSPGFTRVVIEGAALAQYRRPRPADAFKLLLPAAREGAGRPPLRAFTVRRFDSAAQRLVLDVARHERGAGMDWLAAARPGDEVALAGMRPEWAAADGVRDHVLIGDDTAVPAISAIIESLGPEHRVWAYVAVTDPADITLLPAHPNLEPHRLGTVTEIERHTPGAVSAGRRTQVWVAAEAGAVRRVRAHVLGGWGVAHRDLLARAYWKRGYTGTDNDALNLLGYREAVTAGADIHDPAVAERIDLGVR